MEINQLEVIKNSLILTHAASLGISEVDTILEELAFDKFVTQWNFENERLLENIKPLVWKNNEFERREKTMHLLFLASLDRCTGSTTKVALSKSIIKIESNPFRLWWWSFQTNSYFISENTNHIFQLLRPDTFSGRKLQIFLLKKLRI